MSGHDPEGNALYGVDVFVDPDYRGLRLGRRLYDARKQLCETLNLKSIIFGGRIPGLRRIFRSYDTRRLHSKSQRQRNLRSGFIISAVK